jgi:hypothetical protein
MYNYISDIKSRSSGRPGVPPSVLGEKAIQNNKSLTLLWGATGEQEWTPALTTGELNNRGYSICNGDMLVLFQKCTLAQHL